MLLTLINDFKANLVTFYRLLFVYLPGGLGAEAKMGATMRV